MTRERLQNDPSNRSDLPPLPDRENILHGGLPRRSRRRNRLSHRRRICHIFRRRRQAARLPCERRLPRRGSTRIYAFGRLSRCVAGLSATFHFCGGGLAMGNWKIKEPEVNWQTVSKKKIDQSSCETCGGIPIG